MSSTNSGKVRFGLRPILMTCKQNIDASFVSLVLLGLVFFAISSSPKVFAKVEIAREFIELKHQDASLVIKLNDGEVSISPLNAGTVEVFYKPENTKQLPSFAIADKAKRKNVRTELVTTNFGYEYRLAELSVHIQTKPFKLSYYNQNGLLSSEEVGLFNYETIRGFRFGLNENEKLLGGGQRVLGMDRRGQRMPLYNRAHYGYNGESKQMYYGLPAVMSNKGYIIAFDNSANGFLDIGHTESNVLQFEADAGRTSYIFSAGNSHAELVKNFVQATGTQPLPPRWALGNFASRFGYKSQQQVLNTINLFIEQDIPVDAVVLDLYWFGADIKGHMGNLNWDKNNWPAPEEMISELKQKGVDTIVITEPFILKSSSQFQSAKQNRVLAKNFAGEPRMFDFYFGNTGLVDVFDQSARDWFWQYYQKLNDQGVSGWWGDLGEPEVHPADSIHLLNNEPVTANEIHNAYGHRWAQMVYEKQQQASPNRRPFIMMRAGFIGSQRYGMIPWTGDVDRSWGGLKPQVELALQMSMFGLAYTHSDLGGFAGGESFDAELYTRWLQYGAFQAVYRPHAQDHIAPEPVFHDNKTKSIVREYVKLRYRLLPYNYSLSMANSLTGLPMMSPLFMHFPEQSMERTDAYMWGDAFLVAPIIEAGKTSKTISLPQGYWFNYWTNEIYSGQQSVSIDAPLETLPVLVKAGSFVPSVGNMQHTKKYNTKQLQVDYYHHAQVSQSNYIMFDDDGIDPDSLTKNKYQRLIFKATNSENKLDISVKVEGTYSSAPRKRLISFVVQGIDSPPIELFIDGKLVKLQSENSAKKSANSAFYDSNKKQLWLTGWLVNQLDIEITN